MQARFIKEETLCDIELIPDGKEFDNWGYVEVLLTHINSDSGSLVFYPLISVNSNVKVLTPQQAKEWGSLLMDAAVVARLEVAPWFSASVVNAIREARQHLAENGITVP